MITTNDKADQIAEWFENPSDEFSAWALKATNAEIIREALVIHDLTDRDTATEIVATYDHHVREFYGYDGRVFAHACLLLVAMHNAGITAHDN